MTTNVFIGKKVRLSVFDPEKDADLMAKWNRDSLYDRLLDSDPARQWTPKQIKAWMEKEDDLFFFMIHDLADDRAIGLIDLSGVNWTARHAWVGIGLGERENWGKGYGTDAMQVVLRYAFTELNLLRVNLSVFGYNERGYKSYLKSGFVEEGRLREWMARDGQRYDLIFMGILRSEWEALQQGEK